jgi:hypothetical protein
VSPYSIIVGCTGKCSLKDGYTLHKVEDTQSVPNGAHYTFESATIGRGYHRSKEDISLGIHTPKQVRELEERVVSCPSPVEGMKRRFELGSHSADVFWSQVVEWQEQIWRSRSLEWECTP